MSEMQAKKEPGIYVNSSWEDYCATPALNASRLKWGLVSAEHLRMALEGGFDKRDSPDMAFGRGLHARLLEPQEYAERFVIAGPCEELLASGKHKGAPCGAQGRHVIGGKWVCDKHSTKQQQQWAQDIEARTKLTVDQARRIEGAADAIKSHKVVKLLRQRGGFESTVVFDLEGVRCKCRVDKLIATSPRPLIIDLKKCQVGKATVDECRKSIANYAYEFSAAWYVDGVRSLLGNRPEFIWVFQEDAPPYGTQVIQADREDLLVGRMKYREAFGVFMTARATGEWPGYCQEVTMGGLTEWEKRKWLG